MYFYLVFPIAFVLVILWFVLRFTHKVRTFVFPFLVDPRAETILDGHGLVEFNESLKERFFGTWLLFMTMALVLTGVSVMSWPNSTFYTRLYGSLGAFNVSLFLAWRGRVLSRDTTARLYSAAHFSFMICASYVSGPNADAIFLQEYSLPFVALLVAIMVDVTWALEIMAVVVICLVVYAHDLVPRIQNPWFCVECMTGTSKYLPIVVSISIICMYSHLAWDDRFRNNVLINKFKQAARMKDDFVAQMAHDLRTPLNGALGGLQLLDPLGMTAAQKENINIVQHCCIVLNLLIENVLLHGVGDVPEMIMKVQEVEVSKFFEKLLAVFKGLSLGRDIDVKLIYATPVPQRLMFPRDGVMQILLNLGSNALKFQTKGTVRVIVQYVDDFLECEVHDEGPGIRAEFAANRLFVPYSRDNTNVMGTGLGLWICRRLATSIKGNVMYRPGKVRGSVFSVRIPALVPLEALPEQSFLNSPHRDESTELLESTKVRRRSSVDSINADMLIVDDSKVNVMVLTAMIRRIKPDARIVHVEEGASALQVLLDRQKANLKFAPLLVFLDWNMPVMDGQKTLQIWRNLESTAGMRKCHIVVTSAAGNFDAKVIEDIDGVLNKPVTLEGLQCILKTTGHA